MRRRIGSPQGVVGCEPLGEGPVELRIDADRDTYRFSYSYPGSDPVRLGAGETRYLATEVAGVYTGIYATGHGTACSTPAYWDWFEYNPAC